MKCREPRAYGVRCFPFSDVLSFLLDRKRKRFLACARNDGMGKRCGDTTLPPSYGRRCPEGAEVGSRSGIKRNGEGAFSHITFPSTAEGAFFVYRSLFPSRMKRRDLGAHGVCFPFSDALPFLLDRKRKRFLAFARNDGTGKTVFSHRFLSHAGRALSVTIGRSKSFCCLSEIKKEHCHRAMLFLTFCAYQKYSFQTRKIVPSGKFRRACILIPALRARG